MSLAFVGVCTVANAQVAPGQETVYENSIQVNGTAEREIVPDEIYIRIVISKNDTKSWSSVDKMESDMVLSLRQIGVDVDNDLSIGDMSSSAYSKVFGKNTSRTTAVYQLKVSSAEMLGSVYQALGKLGISNLSIMALSHSRIREITDEVRIEAVKNAREIALGMARAIGQDIGRAVFIADYINPVFLARSNYKTDAFTDNSAGAEEPVSLDFRNIKLNYSVTVKFALE